MESALRTLTIQSLKTKLSSCEEESAALAREVLSPSTNAGRRTEVLIRRASIQTRSVALWRELQQLQIEGAQPLMERRIHVAKPVCRVLPAHPEGRIVGELA